MGSLTREAHYGGKRRKAQEPRVGKWLSKVCSSVSDFLSYRPTAAWGSGFATALPSVSRFSLQLFQAVSSGASIRNAVLITPKVNTGGDTMPTVKVQFSIES